MSSLFKNTRKEQKRKDFNVSNIKTMRVLTIKNNLSQLSSKEKTQFKEDPHFQNTVYFPRV